MEGTNLFDLDYHGELRNGKMHAKEAEYTFPTGTVYKGGFHNGFMHGEGKLYFPGKGVYSGVWDHGNLVSGSYMYEDGLQHESDTEWGFCTEVDRRYWAEQKGGVNAAGSALTRNILRNQQSIPVGTYDCMDGYFDPKSGDVHEYETGKVVRTPTEAQKEVILSRAFYQFESKTSE